MKKCKWIKYIAAVFMLVLAVSGWYGTKQAAGAVQRLEEITAYYTGQAVEVGDEIDIDDFFLSAKYYVYDGYFETTEYEDVKKGFTISPSVIKNEGENKIVVTYKGKSTVVSVEGKVVESITADYTGDELYVGSTIPQGKVEVYAYFSDGSYEKVKGFTLSVTTVAKEGLNTVPVVYGGKMQYIYVYGKAPLAVEEIMAYYMGEPVIAGNPISKSDIEVMVLYNDGTMKKVTNFNISPSIAEEEGENEITVSYGDKSTEIEVFAEERYITEMRAKYIGPGVIVGKTVKKDEFEVIVTYNDGSDEETEEFDIYGDEILWEGENIVLVYCDSFMADVVVYGVKGFAANYDNSISNYFVSPDYSYYTEVTLGMNVGLQRDKFMLRAVDEEMLTRVVQRVVPTENFVGFELFYDDDEMVLEFPMAVKVTVPDGFEPEKLGVYYTPNQSTIMAKVDGEFLDEEQTLYEFLVYEPGVYVLVNEESDILVTEIIVETELELKVNRSYSLNPVVFPLTAENRDVEFWSTDEDVATVSDNGKIRTHSEGECEIWIEAQDGSGTYVVVMLEVSNGRK